MLSDNSGGQDAEKEQPVPGKVVKTARTVTVKMSRHYWYADKWRGFEQRLSMAC